MPLSSLETKLTTALSSREQRQIRRRLPDPSSFSSRSGNPIDFSSNDYLSLSSSAVLRQYFISKLSGASDILGSGGSRLLVNGRAHSNLEARLATLFRSEAALLFNSGFDANVGFFSCVPQPGDFVIYDEYIHASVHDGIRSSRARQSHFAFSHNCLVSFQNLLTKLKDGNPGLSVGHHSLFVAVESLYSMDGTFAPLKEIVDLLDKFFPKGNAYLIVDEAHSTGLYGPMGRGRVALLGLENKVFVRLHTFGKALAATGAVLLTNTLIKDYLLNYARSLIYTTSLSNANIIAANCSFDMLENGVAQQLANKLLNLSTYFLSNLRPRLLTVPLTLLSLPPHLQQQQGSQEKQTTSSPIIPIMTAHPRLLSSYLLQLGMNARPITWPTVPKGKDRVRICLHAGNTKEDIDKLVDGMLAWAQSVLDKRQIEVKQMRIVDNASVFIESKL